MSTGPGARASALGSDWNGLLSRIAEDYEIPVLRHEDPAATWESLIIRISTQKRDAAARKSGLQSAVHDSEADALRALGARLAVLPFDDMEMPRTTRVSLGVAHT